MSEDIISRQAAIDALIKWYGCEPSDIGAFENIIDKLPSAQETHEERTETHACDLISRQAAIDVVEKWFGKIELNPDICIDGLISLPEPYKTESEDKE